MVDYLLYKTFEGWLTDKEATELYRLATKANQCIVEIGAYKGKSTTCLLCGSYDGNKVPVHTIDTFFAGSVEFKNNINFLGKEISDLLKVHTGFSKDIIKEIPNNIDLLFIDGSHDWFNVMQDFTLYYPNVVSGGAIVFHDFINWWGVKEFGKFLDEFFLDAKHVDSLYIIDKNNELPMRGSIL